ncbi:MAG TPA: TolC family protein [Gemmatimonadaceae bacterium]|jgi:outer membrane protein TolC|nr:TolC family protein [Gemmatimonadaceae bacterium]
MRRFIPILTLLCALAPDAAGAQRTDTLSLSLSDAVNTALRGSDEVRIANAQVDLAESQLTIARAGVLPQLRFSGSYQHVYENARGRAVGQIFFQPNTYTANANLSQTLFQGGREFAASRAAGRLRGAARLTADETRAQLSLDVQRAYLQTLFAGRVLDIRAASLEQASARLTQVEQFQNAGRAARYDVLRARVERANFEPLVIQARSDVELATLELKRLLNIPIERPIRLTTVIEPRDIQGILASVDASQERGEDRASIRAAELTARARRDAVTVARADFFPTVSAFIQWGFAAFPLGGFPTSSGQIGNSFCPGGSSPDRICNNGGWFEDRFLGVNVSWPLFDGLRTKGNLDLARAQARLADAELTREREAVAVEVAAARAELERARSLFAARRENATEADEAFRLASLRFTRGLGTQLEISDAQLALLTAQTDEARAIFDLYLASAELARALGKPLPMPALAATGSTTSLPDSSASPNDP